MSISFRSAIGRCSGVIHPVSVRRYYFRGAAESGLSSRHRLETPLQQGMSVQAWLDENPRIRDNISWEHTGFLGLGSASTGYRDWSPAIKEALQSLVDVYAGCGMSFLSDPPENQFHRNDNQTAGMRYTHFDAINWYLAFLAQTLVVEMGRWVPWSLNDYADDVLYYLLDSRTLFSWQIGDHYDVLFRRHAPSEPAEPRFTYEFLYRNDLIGNDRVDTISRVIDWCRWNLSHFYATEVSPDVYVGGDYATISMDIHWQYRGFPPAKRIIEQTTRTGTGDTAHWTAGCHGTVGFLRSVLRAVNIPVAYVRRCDHAMPHFLHEDLYLSHGDDPYNRCAKRDDLPARNLLIDQATFERYFSGAHDCDNVGKGVRDATAGLPVLPDLPDSCFS